MTRDEIVEVMAKGAYAKNGWWQVCADDDDGKGRYSMTGYTKLRAVEWDDLDAKERNSRLAEMEAILTALEAKGLVVPGWQPIETAPKGHKVLVAYRNRLGKWRQVIACCYGPEDLDSDETESGFAPEGWYEESETQDSLLPTDEPPEVWQPLPPPPAPTERGKDDE